MFSSIPFLNSSWEIVRSERVKCVDGTDGVVCGAGIGVNSGCGVGGVVATDGFLETFSVVVCCVDVFSDVVGGVEVSEDEADSSGVVGAVATGGFGVEGSGIGSEWLFPPPPPQALITRVLNIKAENLIFDIVVELLYFY